ncbi:MAG: hypothetical protein L0312_05540 [Acidobacteria bacterium]|nr:hypothetical protein [Acidobacteriota bacterium]
MGIAAATNSTEPARINSQASPWSALSNRLLVAEKCGRKNWVSQVLAPMACRHNCGRDARAPRVGFATPKNVQSPVADLKVSPRTTGGVAERTFDGCENASGCNRQRQLNERFLSIPLTDALTKGLLLTAPCNDSAGEVVNVCKVVVQTVHYPRQRFNQNAAVSGEVYFNLDAATVLGPATIRAMVSRSRQFVAMPRQRHKQGQFGEGSERGARNMTHVVERDAEHPFRGLLNAPSGSLTFSPGTGERMKVRKYDR